VKGVRRLGVRVGNWLTAEQGKRLLDATRADTLRGKRNHAMLSLLIGCGLRRAELLGLTMNSIQLRDEHWVIADLVGKGGHIRTVPIPLWVKRAVDSWTESARLTSGRVPINQQGWQNLGRRDDAESSLASSDVISQAANWIRSNSSLGTCPYKQLNDTWAVSRSFGLR